MKALLLSLTPSPEFEIFGQRLILLAGLTENLLCAESYSTYSMDGHINTKAFSLKEAKVELWERKKTEALTHL